MGAVGSHARLRDFSGGGSAGSKLQYSTGAVQMDIDFNDFNAVESSTGNGGAIKSSVYNRRIFNLTGPDVTNAVLAEINADTSPDTPLSALPAMLFFVGPGVLDNNGAAEGKINNSIVSGRALQEFESGKWDAVIAGDVTKGTKEVAGVIVVTSKFTAGVVRQTGGFILYRK